mmetsp:Transcript_6887/g.28233  ORF Transcript_6887/g.28233 Transcript_6887/m.28233 type:complete len:251 (+) Transcript_6887:632-1384(+)
MEPKFKNGQRRLQLSHRGFAASGARPERVGSDEGGGLRGQSVVREDQLFSARGRESVWRVLDAKELPGATRVRQADVRLLTPREVPGDIPGGDIPERGHPEWGHEPALARSPSRGGPVPGADDVFVPRSARGVRGEPLLPQLHAARGVRAEQGLGCFSFRRRSELERGKRTMRESCLRPDGRGRGRARVRGGRARRVRQGLRRFRLIRGGILRRAFRGFAPRRRLLAPRARRRRLGGHQAQQAHRIVRRV